MREMHEFLVEDSRDYADRRYRAFAATTAAFIKLQAEQTDGWTVR